MYPPVPTVAVPLADPGVVERVTQQFDDVVVDTPVADMLAEPFVVDTDALYVPSGIVPVTLLPPTQAVLFDLISAAAAVPGVWDARLFAVIVTALARQPLAIVADFPQSSLSVEGVTVAIFPVTLAPSTQAILPDRMSPAAAVPGVWDARLFAVIV